jgi:pimeloyl-ACP methyl ester carboxylesterase
LVFRFVETPRPPGAVEPTIVLVHGIGMSHRYLSRLHRELSTRARVISVDLPGFGGLPKPAGDVDVTRMASALAAAFDVVREGRIVLVGHSMGAQWVIEWAAQRPASVASVVAIGPVVDERHRTAPRQALALGIDTLGESPLVNGIVFTDYLRCGVPWYQRQLKHMLAYGTEQRIRDVRAPVLIIRGGADPVAGRSWCRALRDAAGTARLVEIPGRRHVVQHSAAHEVASAVLRHLDEVFQVRPPTGGARS